MPENRLFSVSAHAHIKIFQKPSADKNDKIKLLHQYIVYILSPLQNLLRRCFKLNIKFIKN